MEHIDELIKRIDNHTYTDEDLRAYNSWCNQQQINNKPIPDYEAIESQMFSNISNSLNAKPRTIKLLWYKIAAAAVILLVLAPIIYYTVGKNSAHSDYANDITPGKNQATLKLSNGKIIDLNTLKTGEAVMEGDVQIFKTLSGKLIYKTLDSDHVHADQYNTIETPRGGDFQVTLPDGTKAWLNAASKLTYPVLFKTDERLVQISGEVYFEVAKDKNRPFKVRSDDQLIEVLGTHFNVNAYPEERNVLTTLLEGSVKITANEQHILLIPGQEAQFNKQFNQFQKHQVNVETTIAWTRGVFKFNNTSLADVMKQLSRWYDVEVVYQKQISDDDVFTGKIDRNENLTKTLKILELSDLHFIIRDRTIIVTK